MNEFHRNIMDLIFTMIEQARASFLEISAQFSETVFTILTFLIDEQKYYNYVL